MYLHGPCSSKPCILRVYCTFTFHSMNFPASFYHDCKALKTVFFISKHDFSLAVNLLSTYWAISIPLCSSSFSFIYCIVHKYFWGGYTLHISTEIWIKEWSVFDGFGTTCCYCLCLNNSLLNHCMKRFSQRQDATQKVTEFIGFHENHLISILGTIVSVCNTAVHSNSMHGVPAFRDFWSQQVSWSAMIMYSGDNL